MNLHAFPKKYVYFTTLPTYTFLFYLLFAWNPILQSLCWITVHILNHKGLM